VRAAACICTVVRMDGALIFRERADPQFVPHAAFRHWNGFVP
jgi:hypothetical protein